jgi:pimeloyl-ACP methyl ester carboxylesterase
MAKIDKSEQIDHSRRRLFGAAAVSAAVAQLGLTRSAPAQTKSSNLPAIKPGANTSFGPLKQIDAGDLNVGYAEAGPANGSPVILLHGWPYDIYSFVDVAPLLAQAGYRVIVPFIRGYGTTRFLSDGALRNGQPAAVAVDTLALMDALKIEQPILAGFDWGARTANIIAALWPERCKAMVSVSGYLIGSQQSGRMPLPPKAELQWWYQFYFATERGRDGYDKYRRDFSKLIWQLASTMPLSSAAPRPSTIPITSPSPSTITAGALASPTVNQNMTIWKSGWRSLPSSRCRPSPLKATPTARHTRSRALTRENSRASTSTGPLRAALATICRKRRRRLSPRPLSISAQRERRRNEIWRRDSDRRVVAIWTVARLQQ